MYNLDEYYPVCSANKAEYLKNASYIVDTCMSIFTLNDNNLIAFEKISHINVHYIDIII